MPLQDELNKLTKPELISLMMSKRIFLRVEKRDIMMVKIETLSKKAEIDGQKALDDMDKYGGKDRQKWFKAHKDYDKAMKIYNKIDRLYEEMKI